MICVKNAFQREACGRVNVGTIGKTGQWSAWIRPFALRVKSKCNAEWMKNQGLDGLAGGDRRSRITFV